MISPSLTIPPTLTTVEPYEGGVVNCIIIAEWVGPWKSQNGTTKDGKPVEAVLEGGLGDRLDRIDVMGEVPAFVKNIVAAAAGTKPYIYQVGVP